MKKLKAIKDFDLLSYISKLPIVRKVIAWAKTHSLPGCQNVPMYDIVLFIYHEITSFDLGVRASAIAYSFFISLVPSLLTLFTLLPFLQKYFLTYLPEGENFQQILQEEIQKIMPGEAGMQLFSFINDITDTPRVGLLSFGFLLAIYFSSNGMVAMMRGFEKNYELTFKKRTTIKKRMIAIGLTGLMGLLLVASIVLIILGNVLISWLAQYIGLDWFSTISLALLRWLGILFLFYFGIFLIYRYGAATHRKFGMFSPGVSVATFLSILTSVAFSIYIDDFGKFSTYSKFYGSIATIIILMLWIQLNSLILLIGFELNAAIAVNKDLKKEIHKAEKD